VRSGLISGLTFCGVQRILGGQIVQQIVWSMFRKDVKFRRSMLVAQMMSGRAAGDSDYRAVAGVHRHILALQMAPRAVDYGQLDKVANIIAIAVFRELDR
jgi:hypothetical protein